MSFKIMILILSLMLIPTALAVTPESPLYPADTTLEKLQLMFTFNASNKEALQIKFAEERIEEMEYCLQNNYTNAFNKSYSNYLNYAGNNTRLHENAFDMLNNNTNSPDTAIQNIKTLKGAQYGAKNFNR